MRIKTYRRALEIIELSGKCVDLCTLSAERIITNQRLVDELRICISIITALEASFKHNHAELAINTIRKSLLDLSIESINGVIFEFIKLGDTGLFSETQSSLEEFLDVLRSSLKE